MASSLSADEFDRSGGRPWQPDLAWVTEHVGVGGSFPNNRAAELARDHEVRAVIDLRGESCDDEEALRAAGIAFLHLPTPDVEPVDVEKLDRGVEFAKQFIARGEKVVIHCQHGIGRSALLALCVLVDSGLEPLEALRHAKDRREKISPSASQYLGWARWLRAKGYQVPDQHSFGCIAYRHLAER
jgi:protein-tyrosine phosphatase